MSKLYGISKAAREMIEHENKLADALSEIRRYCKCCGATNYVPKGIGRKPCKVCGTSVYYDEKAKFKYKLEKRLISANKRRTIPSDDEQPKTKIR